MNVIVINPMPPFFSGDGPDFPDHSIVSIDDEQCRAILVRLGLSNRWSKNVDFDGPEVQAMIYSSHPTHHLCFVRWYKTGDDGYVMCGFPKSKFSQTEAAENICLFCEKVGAGDGYALVDADKPAEAN